MAAPMVQRPAQIQRYIFQNLWKSRLSYRQCSTLKQSIKDILNDDVTKESKKRVVAEVKRQLVSDMSEGSPLSVFEIVVRFAPIPI